MIRSYRDKRTEQFSMGQRVSALHAVEKTAVRRLDILDAATSLDDLRANPGNRLERLTGTRRGQYSIRINDQWRICFVWDEGDQDPSDVEIVDYH